jgi:thermostable 8-oxoguanine DNA glycosylase
VKRNTEPISIERIRASHLLKAKEIRNRLSEFRDIWQTGTDLRIWEEMVFCFFTGGCSAKMGLRSIDAVRPLLMKGEQERPAAALTGVHRFPNARARYIVACSLRYAAEDRTRKLWSP